MITSDAILMPLPLSIVGFDVISENFIPAYHHKLWWSDDGHKLKMGGFYFECGQLPRPWRALTGAPTSKHTVPPNTHNSFHASRFENFLLLCPWKLKLFLKVMKFWSVSAPWFLISQAFFLSMAVLGVVCYFRPNQTSPHRVENSRFFLDV